MSLPSIPPMRLIFFTTMPPVVVNAVIEALEALGQNVLMLVTTPGPTARRTDLYKEIVASVRHDLDVLVTSHIGRLPTLMSGLEPDVILVIGFPWRLPLALLALPRLGCVNTHPSLLPRYRGPNPLFWQFMNGEARGGLTVHRMDADFDTGPILVQRAIEIAPDDDVDTLFPKFLALGLPILREALALVAAGAPGTPQPTEGASYAPLSTEAERQLDWSRPAIQLRNQIRGWGREGALAEIDGKTVLARRARVLDISPATALSRPGTLLQHSADGMLVQTGQGALLIEDFAPVG